MLMTGTIWQKRHAGIDKSRADTIDEDVIVSQINGERTGHVDHAAFRRCVPRYCFSWFSTRRAIVSIVSV
jgi:hypothetical protein